MAAPLILITNDDGILSPGLHAAAEAVAELGELLIVAPRTQQTAMSRSFLSGPDYGIIEEVPLEIGGKAHIGFAVHGSPAQAVVHAVFEIAPRLPDLCVSGINYGENVGLTTAVSGTVGAALEANACKIPAIAVSREAELAIHKSDTYAELDWAVAGHFTQVIAEGVLRHGLPPEIAVVNLNVPDDATIDTEIRPTVQSQQAYFHYTKFEPRARDRGYRPKIMRVVNEGLLEPNSDIRAFVVDRVVSVTPLTSNLTARVDLEAWFKSLSH